jgi:hypothetical protein
VLPGHRHPAKHVLQLLHWLCCTPALLALQPLPHWLQVMQHADELLHPRPHPQLCLQDVQHQQAPEQLCLPHQMLYQPQSQQRLLLVFLQATRRCLPVLLPSWHQHQRHALTRPVTQMMMMLLAQPLLPLLVLAAAATRSPSTCLPLAGPAAAQPLQDRAAHNLLLPYHCTAPP